nr:DUF3304 domain-containing protein [Klebsiella aerogenes]
MAWCVITITVPIERWEKGQACGFHVHIFPCDKVRIVRSCVLPGGAGSARST